MANRFLSLLLFFEALLVAATWPLWGRAGDFPVVPVWNALLNVPKWVDVCLTMLLLMSALTGSFLALRHRRAGVGTDLVDATRWVRLRWCLVVACVSGIALTLLNQHRLQPWHWLFLLINGQTLLLAALECHSLNRLTVATIYLFAAASRFCPDIDSGMSRQILMVITNAAGLEPAFRDDALVLGACLGMTLTEFFTGLALLIPRLRRLGVVLAVGIHFTLLLTLSPWGLGHHWGVLMWNAFFVFAVPLLFWCEPTSSADGHHTQSLSRTARLVAAFVVLFPFSGLFGVADNWLSWQLYSPRPEVVRISIDERLVDRLPPNVRNFVDSPAPLDNWCPLRVDRWSLAATQAPLYPEDRFQLAVAAHVAATIGDADGVRIEIDEPQFPAWWRREKRTVNGNPDF